MSTNNIDMFYYSYASRYNKIFKQAYTNNSEYVNLLLLKNNNMLSHYVERVILRGCKNDITSLPINIEWKPAYNNNKNKYEVVRIETYIDAQNKQYKNIVVIDPVNGKCITFVTDHNNVKIDEYINNLPQYKNIRCYKNKSEEYDEHHKHHSVNCIYKYIKNFYNRPNENLEKTRFKNIALLYSNAHNILYTLYNITNNRFNRFYDYDLYPELLTGIQKYASYNSKRKSSHIFMKLIICIIVLILVCLLITDHKHIHNIYIIIQQIINNIYLLYNKFI